MTDSRSGGTFQPGDLLNNTYRIEAALGRGGTSEVYRARSEVSQRLVAIKVLRPEFSGNEDYLSLMRREEEVRDIRHDAVVRYSENHRLPDGQVYLVMDFVDGPGLDAKLRDGGMSADDLLVVCARVAEGLNAAHSRNIVHRDLSPDNIILRDGRADQAVIIDFGIAKDTGQGAATIVGGEFAGKYAYAAPEQLHGKADVRTDIYSLGALLLATFRGAPPNVGRNPMEVIEAKGKPLDTEGVPEPLKGLIDKMTNPDPDERFQSMRALLDDMDPSIQQTVVPSFGKSSASGESTVPPKSAAPKKKSGGGGVMVVLLLLLLGGGGAGVWFSGILDQTPTVTGTNDPPPVDPPVDQPDTPIPPVAQTCDGEEYAIEDPYTLIGQRLAGAPPQLIGFAPCERGAGYLREAIAAMGGFAELELASGEVPLEWSSDMASLLERLAPLPEWRLVADGDTVRITGKTSDATLQARLMASLNGNGMPETLKGSAQIDLDAGADPPEPPPEPPGPNDLVLSPRTLEPVLAQYADCGPLRLRDAPSSGYAPSEPVIVEGHFASGNSESQLRGALAALAGNRQLLFNTEVLNPVLCEIEQELPNAPSLGMAFEFTYGRKAGVNRNGVYKVGENPVVDVVLPAEVTSGFLWVSIIDVSGRVYHLLPRRERQENSVAFLRDGATGPVAVRVAYPASEFATDGTKIAFDVSEASGLGKSKIIAIHSAAPLFPELRPREESVGGFAEALKTRITAGIDGIDSRILTTER